MRCDSAVRCVFIWKGGAWGRRRSLVGRFAYLPILRYPRPHIPPPTNNGRFENNGALIIGRTRMPWGRVGRNGETSAVGGFEGVVPPIWRTAGFLQVPCVPMRSVAPVFSCQPPPTPTAHTRPRPRGKVAILKMNRNAIIDPRIFFTASRGD